MEMNLHSLETYLYKYLLPVTFVPWEGFRSVRASFPPSDPNAKTMLLLFFGFWFVMTPFVFWYASKLKRVVLLDESILRVKGYLKEIDIPLPNVESVTESGWSRMRHVTLRLKVRSEFGDRIWFIPKRKLETLGRKSTLEELRERIRSMQSAVSHQLLRRNTN